MSQHDSAPEIGEMILVMPAAVDQHDGARLVPAVVQQVNRSGADLTVSATVFLGDGTSVLRGRIAHRDRWIATRYDGSPYFIFRGEEPADVG